MAASKTFLVHTPKKDSLQTQSPQTQTRGGAGSERRSKEAVLFIPHTVWGSLLFNDRELVCNYLIAILGNSWSFYNNFHRRKQEMTQVKFVLAKESKLSCASLIILVLSAQEISRANRHLVWISTPFSHQFLLKFFYGCLQNSEKEFWILSSEALAQNPINLLLRNQFQTHFPCPVLFFGGFSIP